MVHGPPVMYVWRVEWPVESVPVYALEITRLTGWHIAYCTLTLQWPQSGQHHTWTLTGHLQVGLPGR